MEVGLPLSRFIKLVQYYSYLTTGTEHASVTTALVSKIAVEPATLLPLMRRKYPTISNHDVSCRTSIDKMISLPEVLNPGADSQATGYENTLVIP